MRRAHVTRWLNGVGGAVDVDAVAHVGNVARTNYTLPHLKQTNTHTLLIVGITTCWPADCARRLRRWLRAVLVGAVARHCRVARSDRCVADERAILHSIEWTVLRAIAVLVEGVREVLSTNTRARATRLSDVAGALC